MTERATPPSSEAHLRELKASADHARERHDLYKAKSYGPKSTSPTRLRELKREAERATSALERARIMSRAASPGGADE